MGGSMRVIFTDEEAKEILKAGLEDKTLNYTYGKDAILVSWTETKNGNMAIEIKKPKLKEDDE